MSLLDQIREVGLGEDPSQVQMDSMNIVEFIETNVGLGFNPEKTGIELYPVQKFILKCYYNQALNKSEKRIRIPRHWKYAGSAKPEHYYDFTEAEYLEFLYNEGRANIPELDHQRRELILPIGRRSGKTFISSICASYETYKLLRKGNPQRYYGLPEGNRIQISSIATSKDQASLLFNEVKRHYRNCDYFKSYMARSTQSYVQFHTPYDLKTHGTGEDEPGQESLRLMFYSSVSKGIRGSANIVVIMDEVAFFPRKGEKSAKSVYKAATPSLATFSPKDPANPQKPIGKPEGKLIMISSPYVKEGLFYEMYEKAKTGYKEADKLLLIQAPTWEVNPTVPVEYYEGEFHDNPDSFMTEFGAQFSDRVRSWIGREKELGFVIDKDLKPKTKAPARVGHYLGLDLAVKGDRTAAVLTKPVGESIELVYHELWQAGVPWDELNPHLTQPIVPYAKQLQDVEMLDFEQMADWMVELSKRFYITKGVFDQWNGISFQQSLDRRGLSQIEMMNFTRNLTSSYFTAFKQLMWHGRLKLYDYLVDNSQARGEIKSPYMNELMELEAENVSKHITLVEAPDVAGKYDDFSDALVRSVWLSLETMLRRKDGGTTRPITGGSGTNSGRAASDARRFKMRRRRRRNYLPKRY